MTPGERVGVDAHERFLTRLLRLARRRSTARHGVRRPAAGGLPNLRARLRSNRSRGSTSSATRRSCGSWTSRSARIATCISRRRASVSSAPRSASRGRRCFRRSRSTASESTNQVALGAFPPTSYRAARLTGDLAWELDFWGRVRRGVEAANADLAAQDAAERATVLSLVGDVATSYLQLLEFDQERSIAERTLGSRKSDARGSACAVRAGTHVGARRPAIRGAGRGAGGHARAGRPIARR